MPSVSPHGSGLQHSKWQTSHTDTISENLTSAAGEVGKLQQEFTKRGFKIAALSCNDVESHKGWVWCQIPAYAMFQDAATALPQVTAKPLSSC